MLKTENERYTGTVSVTNNGIPCQDWASSSPHNHTFNQNESFPADGSVHAAKNYCRNFAEFRWGSPFCITTNPDIIDGDCTLRICNGKVNVQFLLFDNGIALISSVSFICRQTIFFAEFGAKFVLKCAAKILKIG